MGRADVRRRTWQAVGGRLADDASAAATSESGQYVARYPDGPSYQSTRNQADVPLGIGWKVR